MVTIETYAREVKHMRSLQQRYFQTRATSVLMVAKTQERKVDDITEKILLAL